MNTFNLELFYAELPLVGGVLCVVFAIVAIFATIAVIQTGSLRFITVGLALLAMVGVVGVLCVAAESWAPTRLLSEDYVNYFNFPDTFWGRAGILGVISVPAMILTFPFFWMESRLLNWAARG